jgi:predicted membrane-bound spermidine synthase
MHLPRWKNWLSYLFPLTLERTGSDKNPELTVVLAQGRLQLLSGNAIYSWDDLYRNFVIALGEIELEKREEADVLLLGLGLGSIPYILEKVYHRDYRYTIVEWDETVAELASRYTLSRLDSPIDVVNGDARVFVEVTDELYDLVIVDIFEDDFTPAPFEEDEFLHACDARLRPGWLLLFNRLHGIKQDKEKTGVFFAETFKRVFPGAWFIDTQGNWILVHRKAAPAD